jgi:putative Mg2+ transporter-C (MgtC) family protein
MTTSGHFLAAIGNLGFDMRLIGRMALGAALGYVVGWKRQFRGSTAGERTFALVALGAAAFTVVGVEDFPATAENVLAGIVTGVGFLGAGMIMRQEGGGGILGLTTAAAIWTSSALGILAGVGEPLIATLATVLTLLLLELEHMPGGRYLDAGRARRAWLRRRPPQSEDHSQH